VQFGVWAQDLFECCIVDDEWSAFVLCHDHLTPTHLLMVVIALRKEYCKMNDSVPLVSLIDIYSLTIARLGEPWDDALIR
jgi:hypothetical protein